MIRWFKPVIFLACLGPLAHLGWKAYTSALGANPIEVITHSTGGWILLHRLIYVSAIAGVIHYLWLVKADIRKPLQYAFVLFLLLGYRLLTWLLQTNRTRTASSIPVRSAEVSEG